ncbi:MAG TPA: single-stranded DNA-binding protein [Mycobacteriales bacterium]|nr:single-stranded DNA-binding protein [Mycobacteriales bacterium]
MESTESCHRNEVTLVGRLTGEISERLLPSGSELSAFRLVVRRERSAQRPTIDTLECVAWEERVRGLARTWSPGDLIEVRGALRRRFWRGTAGAVSRCEVEVTAARRVAHGSGIRVGRRHSAPADGSAQRSAGRPPEPAPP